MFVNGCFWEWGEGYTAELKNIDTPHGKVQFFRIVGLTQKELDDMKSQKRTINEIIQILKQNNPLIVIDLNREET